MTRSLAIIAFFLVPLIACSEMESDIELHPESLESAILRVDVLPTERYDSEPLQGQTVLVNSGDGWQIELSPTIVISGQVTGHVVTPWALSELPGETGPIENATVRLSRENSIQGALVVTDEEGYFSAELVWDSEPYLMEVIPENTQTPTYSTYLFQDDYSSADLGVIDLGAGVALYGQVTDGDGTPIQNARIYTVDSNGSLSEETTSNKLGWYSIRVAPNGNYQVVARGPTARDPKITSATIEVGDTDVAHPVQFQPLNYGLVSGRVLTEKGSSHDNLIIQFRSQQLQGYSASSAGILLESRPTSGLFDVQLPPGRYSIDFIPNEGSTQSPKSLTDIDVSFGVLDMGTISLKELDVVSTVVEDTSGQPIPNVNIRCRESAYRERQWIATTDNAGAAVITLPYTPLNCELIPPMNLPSLARTHILLAGPDEANSLQVLPGEFVEGTVQYPVYRENGDEYAFEELPTAILEFKNDMGLILASTSSDSQGNFQTSMATSQQDDSQ